MSRCPRLSRPLRAAVLSTVVVATLAVTAGPALGQAGGDVGGISGSEQIVDILPVEGYLDPPATGAIVDVVRGAGERGADLVVIQLDSPGSLSADVRGVVEAIRGSSVPVAVFVGPRGRQAGAGGAAGLVLAAGHLSAMAPDATLGPLVPADVGHRGELAGGGPLVPVAQRLLGGQGLASVRDQAVGAERAEELGAVELLADGLEPLLVELDGRTVTAGGSQQTLRLRADEVGVRFHSLGLVRRLLHAAGGPVVVYLLLVAGLGMLLFEVFQPGFGVAGIAGVISTAVAVYGLTVLPVAWWALALVVLGLVLYGVDTAIAGFGPVTLGATATFAAGSWWLYDSPAIDLSWPLVAGTTAVALVFFVVVMTVVLRAQAPPDEAAVEDLVGRVGMVRSMLNPEGHVYVDDALWRARWTGEGSRASVGTPIRVHGVDGPVVLVEQFDPENPGGGTPDGRRPAADRQ